ncbi:MAG: ATP-binding cassette domain-containing protein [Myxococcales bacterium]|nr:ATP-binding cassette domain-containing protein [Myxococcales bacterium]
MIEATALSRRRHPGAGWVFRSFSHAFEAGALTALRSDDPATASGLLRALATLDACDAGELRFDGRALGEGPAAIRRQIGYLGPPAALAATPDEPLSVYARRAFAGRSVDPETFEGLLEMVALDGMGARAVSTLTPDAQRRLALALTLAHDPRWLLLDAPGARLDLSAQDALFAFLRALCETGRVVVVAGHDPSFEAAYCDATVTVEVPR